MSPAWAPTCSSPMPGHLVAPVAYAALVFTDTRFATQTLALSARRRSDRDAGRDRWLIPGAGPGGSNLGSALNRGSNFALVASAVGVLWLVPGSSATAENPLGLWLAVVAGLVVGYPIGKISEWFTSDDHKTVKEVARQSQTGPATLIITGLAEGMRSAAFSVIVVAAGIGVAYFAGDWALGDGGGIYGVADRGDRSPRHPRDHDLSRRLRPDRRQRRRDRGDGGAPA